jgi:hypothetical protein
MPAGKIYKIVCNITNKTYYGSTEFVFLNFRLENHVRCYRLYKLGKRKYQTSFDVLENEDYQIELVEDVDFESKTDLLARERYYIENYECVNKVVPQRTRHEYYLAKKAT